MEHEVTTCHFFGDSFISLFPLLQRGGIEIKVESIIGVGGKIHPHAAPGCTATQLRDVC